MSLTYLNLFRHEIVYIIRYTNKKETCQDVEYCYIHVLSGYTNNQQMSLVLLVNC